MSETKFQVGDEVEGFGLRGKVTMLNRYGIIDVCWEGTKNVDYFDETGRGETWHKEPSLKLIERPKKKVMKRFWLWAVKITDVIHKSPIYMDDEGINTGMRQEYKKEWLYQKNEHDFVDIEVEEEL